jgi:ABC transporter substrate binding protein
VLPNSIGAFVFSTVVITLLGQILPQAYFTRTSLVDRILRGAKPIDLPVQTPTKYQTSLNLKTAKALGLTVPPGLLVAADQVIE